MTDRCARIVVKGSATAIAILSANYASPQNQAPSGDTVSPLETIVVTADKWKEPLNDVPMAVTVITGGDLASNHDFQLQDYVNQVPGMNLISASPVANQLVIRGVTTGAAAINGTVAAYVDETPWTSEGPFANPNLTPNLDTYDMQRIEVLEGPQGTLYGANALGGLMKYVTNPPDPSRFAASAEAGGSTVENGSYGFDLHGMVNVPLASGLALRAVGWDSYYPGYIDDPSRGLTDINGIHVSGGRASLLYQPTDSFSIRLNVLEQDLSAGDLNTVDLNPGSLTPLYGSYAHERLISQPSLTKDELLNATEEWNLRFGTLLSTTSYSYTPESVLDDATGLYGAFFKPMGVAVSESEPVTNLTQEVRISSPSDSRPLLWQMGGYFNNEHSREYEQLFLIDPMSHQVLYSYPTNLGEYHIEPTYQEFAGYADLDYFIVPKFDIAVGGRYSSNNQTYGQVSTGLISGATDFKTSSSDSVVTWSADARWHWTQNTMLYTRVATGYAPGGPNDVLPGSQLPLAYKASTTTNYEFGTKGRYLDGALSADVSLFRINWTRIQIEALVGTLAGITNGGQARSQGFEWSFGYVPVAGVTLNLNGAYTDAYLTQALPGPTVGAEGAMLPYDPRFSSNLSAKYEHSLFAEYACFVGVDWRYFGSRFADFQSITGPRQHLGGYNVADLRTGIETDRYSVTFYVKNLSNTMSYTSVASNTYAGGLGPQYGTVLTPRTVGIDLSAWY